MLPQNCLKNEKLTILDSQDAQYDTEDIEGAVRKNKNFTMRNFVNLLFLLALWENC